MAAAYADGGKDTLSTPITLEEHLSIDNRPLLMIHPSHIAPMPLHLTLGKIVYPLRLGVEAVYFWHERIPAATCAENLANTLRQSVGVAPTPYFNGAFEARQCQRIGQRLSMVCELLAAFVPAAVSNNYNASCATWQRILPIHTRAGDDSSDEASSFRRDAATFVDHLKGASEETSGTAKLHTLCCHSPDVLEQFGSRGRYSEQGLEAWHGNYNKNARLYTSETFLESCLAYVRHSAMARAPRVDAHNCGKRRSPEERAGAHNATRLDYKRTRYGKATASGSPATSQNCREKQMSDCVKWAGDNLTVTVRNIDAYRRRANLRPSDLWEEGSDEAPFAVAPDGDDLLEAETSCLMSLLEE